MRRQRPNRSERRAERFGAFYTTEVSYDIRIPNDLPTLPAQEVKFYISEWDWKTKRFKRKLLSLPMYVPDNWKNLPMLPIQTNNTGVIWSNLLGSEPNEIKQFILNHETNKDTIK